MTGLDLSVAEGGTALLDLTGLDTSPQSPPSFPEFPTPTDSLTAPSQEIGISLLDDELMSLGNKPICASWHLWPQKARMYFNPCVCVCSCVRIK